MSDELNLDQVKRDVAAASAPIGHSDDWTVWHAETQEAKKRCAKIHAPALIAEVERLRARISILEDHLSAAASTLQEVLPIGQVKAIGLLEVPRGVEELRAEVERLRATVSSLPVDATGRRIVPGDDADNLYIVVDKTLRVFDGFDVQMGRDEWLCVRENRGLCVPVSQCWPTAEQAEAAEKG